MLVWRVLSASMPSFFQRFFSTAKTPLTVFSLRYRGSIISRICPSILVQSLLGIYKSEGGRLERRIKF